MAAARRHNNSRYCTITTCCCYVVGGWFCFRVWQSFCVLEDLLEKRNSLVGCQHAHPLLKTWLDLQAQALKLSSKQKQKHILAESNSKTSSQQNGVLDGPVGAPLKSSDSAITSRTTIIGLPESHSTVAETKETVKKIPPMLDSGLNNPKKSISCAPLKFIVVVDIPSQGAGNRLHGLLAAHLLGEEFGRIVCLSPQYWPHFQGDAFDVLNSLAIQHCPTVVQQTATTLQDYATNPKTLLVYNFAHQPIDECHLKAQLAGNETILILSANTYPRWPSVPDHYFLQHYQPTQTLLEVLPYDIKTPPKTTVHLRMGDGKADVRKGLDMVSLHALGAALPQGKMTYLVTNRVEWYDYFEQQFGWSHPRWHTVIHSAIRQKMKWGNARSLEHSYHNPHHWDITTLQTMQLYADWYTMTITPVVYHTYSDFSLSAIHWMNHGKWSRTYDGVDKKTGQLILKKDSREGDEPTKPLVQRSGSELMHCKDDVTTTH